MLRSEFAKSVLTTISVFPSRSNPELECTKVMGVPVSVCFHLALQVKIDLLSARDAKAQFYSFELHLCGRLGVSVCQRTWSGCLWLCCSCKTSSFRRRMRYQEDYEYQHQGKDVVKYLGIHRSDYISIAHSYETMLEGDQVSSDQPSIILSSSNHRLLHHFRGHKNVCR